MITGYIEISEAVSRNVRSRGDIKGYSDRDLQRSTGLPLRNFHAVAISRKPS